MRIGRNYNVYGGCDGGGVVVMMMMMMTIMVMKVCLTSLMASSSSSIIDRVADCSGTWCSVTKLVCNGKMASWLVGRLVGWLVGWLVGYNYYIVG